MIRLSDILTVPQPKDEILHEITRQAEQGARESIEEFRASIDEAIRIALETTKTSTETDKAP